MDRFDELEARLERLEFVGKITSGRVDVLGNDFSNLVDLWTASTVEEWTGDVGDTGG